MLERPDKTDLLTAVAGFLDADVRPAVTDSRVSFRLRIAAHLLRSVAAQIGAEGDADAAERGRLGALVGGASPDLGALRGALVARIRDPATPADELARIRAHLQETLRAELAVAAPRFDTSLEIESP